MKTVSTVSVYIAILVVIGILVYGVVRSNQAINDLENQSTSQIAAPTPAFAPAVSNPTAPSGAKG